MTKDREYLGRHVEHNAEYWREGTEVFCTMNGATRWLCSIAAWSTFLRICTIIPA